MSRVGMDGTIPPPRRPPKYMQGIVIGGPANGMIVKQILVDAARIELARPDYVKPLARSKQETPDTEMIRGAYEVCTIWLADGDSNMPVPFGLIIEEGKSVRWAVSELVKGFAQNVINEISAEKFKQ